MSKQLLVLFGSLCIVAATLMPTSVYAGRSVVNNYSKISQGQPHYTTYGQTKYYPVQTRRVINEYP